MPSASTKAKEYVRARTAEQRDDRREAILAAAEQLLMDVGYQSFTMTLLARRAKLAKGTAYLYFPTRNALMIALFARKFSDWRDMVMGGLRPGIDEAKLVKLFFDSSTRDPLFLELATRLTSKIESQEPAETVADIKRANNEVIVPVVAKLADALGIKKRIASKLVWALISQLIGAATLDTSRQLDPDDFDEDVVKHIRWTSLERVFKDSAKLAIRGAIAS